MATTYTIPCTLTSYEHYYAVGSGSVTINGGSMKVSSDQSVFAVGSYDRTSYNDYSAVMVTAANTSVTGSVTAIKIRLRVSVNNDNAVYVGRVTDTSNLTNWGGIPWYTGSTTGWIETTITSLSYEAGCSYSLIQDSVKTSQLDIIVEEAQLIVTTDATEFTLSYDTQGGSTAPASQTATGTTSASFTISSTVPTRDGYSFEGWATSAGGAVSYQPSETITVTGDVTLYAVWSAQTCTVTFDANGGTVSPTTMTVNYGHAYGTLPTPTRTTGTFSGWYYGDTLITSTSIVSTLEDHTLVADWGMTSPFYYKQSDGVMKPAYVFRRTASGMSQCTVYTIDEDGALTN